MLHRLISYILASIIFLPVMVGQNAPEIKLLKDSVMIGEEFEMLITYQHDPEAEILFPDSSYDFSPFELVCKKVFPTVTNDSVSLDSTIYILQTFELDKLQSIRLNVTVLSEKDSFAIKTNTDTLFLKEVVQQLPDSLKLKANVQYQEVKEEFNYPYWIIALLVFGIFLLASALIFGKSMINRLRIYRWKRRQRKFEERFTMLIHDPEVTNNAKGVQGIISDWKNHLAWIEQEPINSYTTSELKKVYQGKEELLELLSKADEFIYGGKGSALSFSTLLEFSKERLQLKIDQLRK